MSDTPLGPATLVPDEERDALVDWVTAALAVEVTADPGRDAERLDRAVRTALEQVETCLDRDVTPYATTADVPFRLQSGLIQLAAGELKRPGFAYGLAGYDETDPLAVRAYGAILAMIQPGMKHRWGVA